MADLLRSSLAEFAGAADVLTDLRITGVGDSSTAADLGVEETRMSMRRPSPERSVWKSRPVLPSQQAHTMRPPSAAVRAAVARLANPTGAGWKASATPSSTSPAGS